MMEQVSFEEQRHYVRRPSGALVEMHHPSFGTIEIKARDLSDGGIFALMGNYPAPPVGTTVMVRIKRYTGVINQDPVPMRVVHQQSGGIGLAFVR
ncbi:MAG: PilZ domain-containing protein [Spongiibacteraceae bacterium]